MKIQNTLKSICLYFCLYPGIFFLTLTNYSAAQNRLPADYLQYAQKYPKHRTINLNHIENVDVKMHKGIPIMVSHIQEEKLVLDDKEQGYVDESVYFSYNLSVSHLKACYFEPSGDKYIRHSVNEFHTSNYIDDNIFFNDTKKSEVIFPRIPANGRTLVTYDCTTLDPHSTNSFYFTSFLPIVHSEFSITFPENIRMNYILLNNDSNKIKFTEEKKGGTTKWTWTLDNSDAMEFESDAPSIKYFAPHIIVYIEKYKSGKEFKNVFSNLDDLFSWYKTLIMNVSKDTNGLIKKTVDSLVYDTPDTLQRIKKIYYWLQDHINYVAFEDSLSGIVPKSSSDVFIKRYGDCKGMSGLLRKMLTDAGVDAHLTWIGTRDLPYQYSKVFLPCVNDHMITVASYRGENIILDGTAKHCPMGLPTSFIQGKEALVEKNGQTYQIIKVPETPREVSVCHDSTSFVINQGVLEGKAVMTSTGYQKIYLASNLDGLSGSKLKDELSGILQKGNNKFQLTDFSLSRVFNRDSASMVNYSFKLPDYINSIEDQIFINLNIDKVYRNDYVDVKKKKYDMMFKYKTTYQLENVFTIPDGYKLANIPSNSEFKDDRFGFTITYRVEKNMIYYTEIFYLNTIMVTTKDFADWNKMIDKLNNAYAQTITLQKIK